ncbi:methyltransferase domain-containing protein [Poriferisphaera sp. WC338]|uniref:methyltransferase domain-containing protein n=1 Tax=Poriferisphaera sp. WC338 TaxID=3425129 RepID=UPI003D81C43A
MTQANHKGGQVSVGDEGLIFDVEGEVVERYAAGAEEMEVALCCPTSYDPQFLKVIPHEILERDYGCGDPSQWVKEGDVVLDLGSGGGKICYILSQKVGKDGRVIGVDMNDTMLRLARGHQKDIAEKIGWDNVDFRKGKIQDLGLDLEKVDSWLRENPVDGLSGLQKYEKEAERLRKEEVMVGDAEVDVIVSNCVLNLVKPEDKRQLFEEMYRVLKRGGRAVISDIVCDEKPTEKIMNDPKLWSGCISGAFLEEEFLTMFEDAGFYGVEILSYGEEPWQTIDGVEFRSMTVRAWKGKDGSCMERNQAVMYKGPWKKVVDDDGHTLVRGKRMSVCDKTFKILTNKDGPYGGDMIGVEPLEAVALEEAKPFNCKSHAVRHPRETKGMDYNATQLGDGDACCDPSTGCC